MHARPALFLAVAVLSCSCAGFKAVERGEYRRVFAADVTNRTPDSPQDVITRDAYEEEVSAGTRRGWEAPPGYTAPLLSESPKIGLKVGDVIELRVDESTPVELAVDGNAVDVFWNPEVKRDTWKDGSDVTVRESTLFLRGKKPGAATLRWTKGNQSKDVPVTVTP